ncbi:MarR family winged helix-turn-helix transcriptional regulator [Demequina sp. NBRC 110057]|uniref:MarR family winged helix-turn-helix transcriptional regulator n=1 Tax=Demequina sp. NBRC 110057 TaxID=1570346 RepID=UPI0009FE84EA|nr:MarR family transcriptional regulator [Demequina sp. NBRC 110057]
MDDERAPSLSERAPLVEAVRLLEARMRDVAAIAAPDPFSFMTLHQAFLFQHLARAPGGLPQATLVERVNTSAPAVSQMVGRMVLKRLVTIERHPLNERTRLVVPTERGFADYDWVLRMVASEDRRWRGGGNPDAAGTVSLDTYVESGMALWRWERGKGPMP